MIQLEHFCKTYKSFFFTKEAVKDVSFKAEKNSITGLIGPNGAGKTTIIKAICGLHLPTSGNVFVYDKDGNSFSTEEQETQVKKLIGYVSEKPVLYKNFTVYEYLNLMAELWQIKDKEKAIKSVAKECFLQDVMTQKISSLSKGYCQRLSFASALIHNPQVLVLDEPSSGLDPAQIIEMRSLILKMAKTKTVLLSTHIMSEAEILCDQAVIINEGKLVASGKVQDIIKNTKAKNLEDAYIRLTLKGKSNV